MTGTTRKTLATEDLPQTSDTLPRGTRVERFGWLADEAEVAPRKTERAPRIFTLGDRTFDVRHNGPGDHPQTTEFASWSDGFAWGNASSEGWGDTLTADDKATFMSYVNTGFDQTANTALRQGGLGTVGKENLDRIAMMADKLRANTTKSPAVLYRATGEEALGKPFAELETGHTFTDRGFTSTTTSKQQMEEFYGFSKSFSEAPPVILKVYAPTGTKGAFLDKNITPSVLEHEFLMPPGTQFRVIRKEEGVDQFGDKTNVVHVQVIGQP